MNPFESLGNDPTNRQDEPRLAHPPTGGQLYIARLEKQASFAPTNQEPNIHKLFVQQSTVPNPLRLRSRIGRTPSRTGMQEVEQVSGNFYAPGLW